MSGLHRNVLLKHDALHRPGPLTKASITSPLSCSTARVCVSVCVCVAVFLCLSVFACFCVCVFCSVYV